jgi:hypothetical protein
LTKVCVSVEEKTIYEGGPSWTELVVPTVSLLTVVGIFPFLATLARQFWVKYQLTSNRIVVDSGFRGKKHVQVSWEEVVSFRSVRRFGGISGDFVLQLKDGSKLELRVSNHESWINKNMMTALFSLFQITTKFMSSLSKKE